MNLYDAYFLGTEIQYILDSDAILPVVKLRKKGKAKMTLLDILREIQQEISVYEINGTVKAQTDIWVARLEKDYKSGQRLKKEDAKEICNYGELMEGLLCRELIGRYIIELNRKGALNQRALLRTSLGLSSAIFGKEIWETFPEIAKKDFSEGAKCLLIEASTSATMVSLRGIEAVIRKYYTKKTGKPSDKKPLAGLVEELKTLPKANKNLLSYLHYIRAEKRNLAQHPNKTFTQREAERVFMEIISAVHDIDLEMRNDQGET